MGFAGTDTNLWRVRVDLFAVDDDGRRVGPAVADLRGLLQGDGRVTNTEVGGDQGFGATGRPIVGLLFWVNADDVREAAMTAVQAARRAGAAHGVGPDLYDVTVTSKEAVVRPDDPGYSAMPD